MCSKQSERVWFPSTMPAATTSVRSTSPKVGRDSSSSSQRVRKMCMHGASCVKYGCFFMHPPSRPKDCPQGEKCTDEACKLHHPLSRVMKNRLVPACRYGKLCKSPNCQFRHPDDRVNSAHLQRVPSDLSLSSILSDGVCPVVDEVTDNGFAMRCSPGARNTPDSSTTSYFAQTSKRQCIHKTACVKFGCPYAHPPGRKRECRYGELCTNIACGFLHPRVPVLTEVFAVGQKVEAQFKPTSVWKSAVVRRIQGIVVTVQFVGYDDVVDLPARRVRVASESESDNNKPAESNKPASKSESVENKAQTISSRWSPLSIAKRASSHMTSSSKRAPPGFSAHPAPAELLRPYLDSNTALPLDLVELNTLKQTAVSEEQFQLAHRLKQRIVVARNILCLEQEKKAAVAGEDYKRAAQIKQQIAAISTSPFSVLPEQHPKITGETKTCSEQYANKYEARFLSFNNYTNSGVF